MNSGVRNTLQGRTRDTTARAVFNPRTVFLLIILGVFSFSAYFVLAGFSGDLKSGNNGGAHALSKSAVGYGGLMHLLKHDLNTVSVSRSPSVIGNDQYALRIVSLNQRPSAVTLDDLQLTSPTLLILPKWQTSKLPGRKGWVQKRNFPNTDIVSLERLKNLLEPVAAKVKVARRDKDISKVRIYSSNTLGTSDDVSFYNFEKIQTIYGDALEPLVVSDAGTILARITDTDIFILSDPDFMNTRAISKPDHQEFARAMIYALQVETGSESFIFDLSLHGYARSQNLIKLALTPPFLGASLCLLFMGLLIAWQAMMRFGSPAKTEREIALGKLSLIYNAAGFIKRAGRENKMSPDYANLMRKRVSEEIHIPTGLGDKEIDKRLDIYSRHAKTEHSWTELEAESHTPKNAAQLLLISQKIFQWRSDVTRGGKDEN